MKRTKESVDYSRGHPDSRCGICAFFRPMAMVNDRCTKVRGPIHADMWCKLFEKSEVLLKSKKRSREAR